MKVGFLVVARLKSTRLPRKVLLEVCGRPMLGHMLDRLKLCKSVSHVVVCTSTNPQDDELAEFALGEGAEVFRGDEDDVIKRLSDAADAFGLDYILSITADCPFVDPYYADRIVQVFKDTDADLIRAMDLPHGIYSYGYKPSALKKVLEIKDSSNTEVWMKYFTDTGLFKVHDMEIESPLHRQPSVRLVLDYPDDLEFFKVVFDALYRPGEVFTLDEILTFLKNNPEAQAINSHCESLYSKRWNSQSEIRLKERFEVRRAAVVGCGSIGQRHIRNLISLGITDITALRTKAGHHQDLAPELGVNVVGSWEELLSSKPDIAIVSNPTSLHLETSDRLVDQVRGLFIEKPISHSLKGVDELIEKIEKYKTVSFVGFNLQFHPLTMKLKECLSESSFGNPISYQCCMGQWLPDWHPYEDFSKGYYSREDLGGGATRTLCHEINLAIDLLGAPEKVAAFYPQTELLDIDVDAVADIMIYHGSNAISQIHLDFLQRPFHRSGVISCDRGWMSYDFVTKRITGQREEDDTSEVLWESEDYDHNLQYVEELRTFIKFVKEGRIRHPYDVREGLRSMQVIDAAFESSRCSRFVSIRQ